MIGRRMLLAALIGLGALSWGPAAQAHFNLNLNVRILHVDHVDAGLRLYLRTPMPYLVADRIGVLGADGLPAPAPYTTNRHDGERVVHLVDWAALDGDPSGLARMAADGLDVEAHGKRLVAEVAGIRVHPLGAGPDFATLEEARAAFAIEPSPLGDMPETFVGDAIVDILLMFSTAESVSEYTIASRLDPGLPGQEETANLILDHGPGDPRVYRIRGLMAEPVVITPSKGAAVYTFVVEGVRHILEGADHVLFVLCLGLGATGLKSLTSRITGFTIGHSVTLSAGFFGYVPAGGWFLPTVEAGIAISIIYAATIALLPNGRRIKKERDMFLVTCAIGFLHGLGFSFVLQRILDIDAPNLWQSLVAFNVGVELGQLAVIAYAVPVFLSLRRMSTTFWRVSRTALASGCIVVAGGWTAQRVITLVDMV